MATDTSEKELERIICDYLCQHHGYEQAESDDFDRRHAIDTSRLRRFLERTQPEKLEQTGCLRSEGEQQKFLERLSKELGKRGATDVMRNGFRYLTERFDLYYPTPSELNETAKRLYQKNIFSVTRQLHYSLANNNSIDLCLAVNGVPVLTVELKNHLTGQTTRDAIVQYMRDRNPQDDKTALLLQPGRAAAHLAVDDEQVTMCPELRGKASQFLPFNKGVRGGAGNPVHPNGLRTAYLWEDILSKASLSDI
ncbi:MAG: type I restriction endonuclease subunit R, partial [Prevotellaceae bacterium]|nr:type I restriction endonuclease subunit R [Prevotellaceae bacterium]